MKYDVGSDKKGEKKMHLVARDQIAKNMIISCIKKTWSAFASWKQGVRSHWTLKNRLKESRIEA